MPTIHVFIGTKAQYIKTAPVLRLLEDRGVPYRLIDSGQHASLAGHLRRELGVREPDVRLGSNKDVVSIPQAMAWSATLATELLDRRRLITDVFARQRGVCVVHGDTPSTLLAALMARRVGLPVAHLEAGLRSKRLTHPFPEELIRIVVMRLSDILFAPDDEAVRNLRDMGLSDETIPTSGNTVIDALRYSLGDREVTPAGPVVATMHRVENLHRRDRLAGWVRLVERIAAHRSVKVVLHGPTETALEERGELGRLQNADVELVRLLPHAEFTAALAAAPFVVTDGGSIQEECAILGVPTLLWRGHTERRDGLDSNVVLSRYDGPTVHSFLANPQALRVPPRFDEVSPAEEIVDVLTARLETL